jgi:hypothetical protein
MRTNKVREEEGSEGERNSEGQGEKEEIYLQQTVAQENSKFGSVAEHMIAIILPIL